MSETPTWTTGPLRKWTGPMRRVKKYLQAQGWQVTLAGWPFLPFDLVAVHPTLGVKLLWVYQPRGPEPALAALAAFACAPAVAKEVWRFPATTPGPWIRRVTEATVPREGQAMQAEAPRP